MIKCFTFENFKSFEKAELNIEALTTLIGTNASGKSSAIEGISILSMVVTGLDCIDTSIMLNLLEVPGRCTKKE